MCSSYRDLSAHSGGLAGLVLPFLKCLVHGIPSLIGCPAMEDYLRGFCAYNGLSWDTPAGFDLMKAVPMVMWQMGVFNVRL